jgi:transcriptional regulator with XRE-family HTH domain
MKIGEIIKDQRKKLHMTQEDVARAVGTTKATVSRWETGDIHKMKRPIVRDLARVLQLDPVLFCQREEVLLQDEQELIDAYRAADDLTKALARRALGIIEKNDSSESAI